MTATQIKSQLQKLANPTRAKTYARFFKTGPNEYGEGDKFLGITVPEQRKIAKQHTSLQLDEIQKILNSKYHEHRLTSLLILTYQYSKINQSIANKEKIYKFYLNNTRNINNWDLIDTTAPKIIGQHLAEKPKNKEILYKLAKSKNLWERRISIISTFTFIKQNNYSDTLQIAEILLQDKHHLIHKAVGWMLREIGKKNLKTLKKFLNQHRKIMPRIMLRYAIEKLPQPQRKIYMKK